MCVNHTQAFILVSIPYLMFVGWLESIVDIQLLTTIFFIPLSYLPFLVYLFWTFALITAAIRRLHDTDRSGWWLIIPLISFIFLFLEGDTRRNRFGSVPDNIPPDASIKEILFSFPDNMVMSAKSAWKGRERVLAVRPKFLIF